MASHNDLGKKGEALAATWLTGNGYALLHQNWRYKQYEVDFICSKNDILHFFEVKTRSGARFGLPEESVGKKKIRNLMHAAEAYQQLFPEWKRVQYNVLSIAMQPHKAHVFFLLEDVYVFPEGEQ